VTVPLLVFAVTLVRNPRQGWVICTNQGVDSAKASEDNHVIPVEVTVVGSSFETSTL
jgi:hypothetical protein